MEGEVDGVRLVDLVGEGVRVSLEGVTDGVTLRRGGVKREHSLVDQQGQFEVSVQSSGIEVDVFSRE